MGWILTIRNPNCLPTQSHHFAINIAHMENKKTHLYHLDKHLFFFWEENTFLGAEKSVTDLSSSVVRLQLFLSLRWKKHYVTPRKFLDNTPLKLIASFNWKLMELLKDVEEKTSFLSEAFWLYLNILFGCEICLFLRICFLQLQSCPTKSSSAVREAPTSYKWSYFTPINGQK